MTITSTPIKKKSTYKPRKPRWYDMDAGDRVTITKKKTEFSGREGYIKSLRTPWSNRQKKRWAEFTVAFVTDDLIEEEAFFENEMVIGWASEESIENIIEE